MSFKDRLSRYTEKPMEAVNGDFHVAIHGNDEADGSCERPFATLERAARAVREVKRERNGVTVCVHAGEYHMRGLHLTGEDAGSAACPIIYRAAGDGEVVLNGGVTLKPEDFEPIPGEIRERLHGEAKDKTVMIDLKRYGLTKADWGQMHPIGAFGTEDKYDSFVPGANCELFMGGRRMTLSRYPSKDFMQLDAVFSQGDVWEFPEQNYFLAWNDRRNHDGGAYILDKQTAERLKTWKNLENIWVYGYFYHDWADSSSPVRSFDLEHRLFFPEYVARYGAKKGAQFYFYNVLDELDMPGEWYLDREEGILYFYPPQELTGATVEMTITRDCILHLDGADHVTFDGFTLKGTRADAVSFAANDCAFRRLKISGVMGNGVAGSGYRNKVLECDISHVGKGGIWLTGGDRNTLEPGENVADNNLIHDWAEVFLTYFGGVRLDGVGNVCSHNEMYNAPHAAVLYYGNDHLIEYNHIHDVVLHSSDAGAIYSGQDWAGQGCVIRYNCLYGVGSGNFYPDGIYFDDMLSGQTAYGNLLVGARKNGFLIGGGRDNKVYNNIIVGSSWGIQYDDRGRDGFLNNGWAVKAVSSYEEGSMWKRLREVPYQSEIWAQKYPLLAKVSHDLSDPHNPDFAPNPAYSHVHNNLVIGQSGSVGDFFRDVPRYSLIEKNAAFHSEEAAGMQPGEYVVRDHSAARNALPEFKNLPIEKMGRY